jgi:NAD(P)-dependent dehydrogenase (short-subunit alcohol dehydrogenase family)
MKLDQATVLITGANRGLGLASAWPSPARRLRAVRARSTRRRAIRPASRSRVLCPYGWT